MEEGFACLCREGAMEDFPNSFGESDDFAAAVASLDVHDYLQRDADALFEAAFLSLRSDASGKGEFTWTHFNFLLLLFFLSLLK